MAYVIRPMRLQDITQVAQIERESFPSPWSTTSFRYELLFNKRAHYFIACGKSPQHETDSIGGRKSWLDALLSPARRLFHEYEGKTIAGQWVVGYAGLWFTADEAHLITIAVRQAYRQQGIGEFLLISAIELALERNAQSLTLEVRPSNTAAQALYRKYGFVEAGLRRGYYYDTGEDALLMTAERLTSAPFQSEFQRLKQAHARRCQ